MIEFDYLALDGMLCRGSWNGEPAEAIAVAAEYLGATLLDDGAWIYHADETGRDYRVSSDNLAVLGAALLATGDVATASVYSLWCTCHGEEVTS